MPAGYGSLILWPDGEVMIRIGSVYRDPQLILSRVYYFTDGCIYLMIYKTTAILYP